MLTPLVYLSFTLKGELGETHEHHIKGEAEMVEVAEETDADAGYWRVGIGANISKHVTHLPPYIGMLVGLGNSLGGFGT